MLAELRVWLQWGCRRKHWQSGRPKVSSEWEEGDLCCLTDWDFQRLFSKGFPTAL